MTSPAKPMTRNLTLSFFILLSYSAPVLGQLQVDFASDKPGGCSPMLIHLSSQTTGASANAVYKWDFGNGNSANTATPGAVYVTEGVYTITLTVRDGGNSATASHTVTVYPSPTVSFTALPTSVCMSTPVTFSSASTAGSGTISSYLWDFGDGVTQQGSASQSHLYQQAGIPPVSLTVTNSNGCSKYLEMKDMVKILPEPTASFITDKKVLCLVTDPVQFINGSTGQGALSYLWDFGDGNTSTQANPSYSFSNKGVYTVKLTTTNPDGCSATFTQANYLNVASYNTDFDLPAATCQGVSMTFNDKSVPTPDSRVWEVDGANAGTAAPLQMSFTSAGMHTIKLTDNFGGCSQSATKQITIQPSPVPPPFDISVQGVCGAPITVNFTDHTPGALAWDWNFRYDPTDNFPVIVHEGPTTSTQFYNNYQPYTVLLKVTDANGCSDTISEVVMVHPPVFYIQEVDPSSESACDAPITHTYQIQHPELLQSWTWDFSDGTTSTDLQPTHTFSAYGQYEIILHYVTKDGCKGSTNSLYATIAKPLKLDFSIPSTTVCAGSNILLDATSLYLSDAIFFSFNFGDGSPSSFYPQHIYTTPGVYTVTMNAENAACATSVVKPGYITVIAPVGAYLGFSNTCDGERNVVTFNFSPGSASSLVWDFGDGSSVTTDGSISQLTHTYAANGDYNMTVNGGNAYCAVSGSDQLVVFMKQHPTLTADQTAICPDGTLAVNVSNYDLNPWVGQTANDYTLQFQYGDSTNFGGTITTDYYNWVGRLSQFKGGESGIRLITTSIHFGCNDTTNIVPLTIKGVATGYEIIQDDRCLQSPVVLQDTSKVSTGNSILSLLWDFGDGQTSTQSGTVSHTYADPGSYTVKLTVKDASGCSSSSDPAIAQVTVNGPKADFSPSGTNVPLNSSVIFSNTSNTYGSNPKWTWDFGDNTSSNDLSPAHTYPQAGTYIVTLTARDPVTGCSSVAKATIVVDAFGSSFSASASYVAQGHCPPLLVQFTNHSINYTGVHWDFGDGVTADNQDAPSHVYEKAGQYTVTLTVTGANGLSAQYTQQVVVDEATASLSAVASAVCTGQSAQLKATAAGAIEYTWDFGDGSVGNGSDAAITHIYSAGGNYDLKLLVTDVDGCTAAADAGLSLEVHAPPTVTVLPVNPFICLNASVMLNAQGGKTYSWSPPLGLDQTDVSTPLASPIVTTDYQVIVTDDIGCQNTGKITVEVIQPLSVTANPQSASLCPGETVTFHAAGAFSYSWIDNITGLSNTQSADPVVKPMSSGIYTVSGTDVHSCFTDTAEITVTLLPVPSVNAGPDVAVLAGNPITLDATGSTDVTQWSWSPPEFLSCANCAQPVCTPKQNVQYIVTVKNADGCTASDTVAVKLECEEARVAVPNAFTPNGDGHNDRFVIQGIAEIDHLVIYDRWGVKVFERNNFLASDRSACWDGTMHGQMAPTGVYAYFIGMHCPTGSTFTKRGTVVLVR